MVSLGMTRLGALNLGATTAVSLWVSAVVGFMSFGLEQATNNVVKTIMLAAVSRRYKFFICNFPFF